ncbi:MAG: cation transporter [Marinifilaceae bacterium]
MKNVWMLLLVSGLLLSCQTNSKKTESKEKTEVSKIMDIQELELDVKGMTCTGCEKSVENGLKQIDGVVEVKASHKENKVLIKIEKNKMDREAINQKIETIGYSVQ